jgi:serine/threonine protein kinase
MSYAENGNALVFQRGARIAFEGLLGRPLAEGGSGRVFEAFRRPGGADDVFVAKVAKMGAERVLEVERRACELLDHPNVVRSLGAARSRELGRVLALERLGTNPLLALNGREARPRFRDPGSYYYPLPPGSALELAFDLVHALAYVHARGYAHGDVKLGNFMVRTPRAAYSSREVLASVARGAFEGVLIDLSSVRPVAVLEEIASGKRAAEHGPGITPLYAPPEAVVVKAGARPVYSTAMDVYAFGLVLYAMVTGRAPYASVCTPRELRNLDVMREIKAAEGRGVLSPVDEAAFDEVPLHDVAFVRGARHGWPVFRSRVSDLVRRCLDPDPGRRLRAVAARDYLARELLVLPAKEPSGRRFVQGLIAMRPGANRLLGDAPHGGIKVAFAGGEIVAEEREVRPARQERPREQPRRPPRPAVPPVPFRAFSVAPVVPAVPVPLEGFADSVEAASHFR